MHFSLLSIAKVFQSKKKDYAFHNDCISVSKESCICLSNCLETNKYFDIYVIAICDSSYYQISLLASNWERSYMDYFKCNKYVSLHNEHGSYCQHICIDIIFGYWKKRYFNKRVLSKKLESLIYEIGIIISKEHW